MKNKIITALAFLALAFPSFYINGASATEEEESALDNEDENLAEEADETESHLKDKKKKNSKSIKLPTAVIGGGNGKQDFSDVILLLDREVEKE